MATSGLGHLLVKEGLLTEADRLLIRRVSGAQGGAFARGVLAIGLLDEDELAAFLAEKTRWRVADKDLSRESRHDAWDTMDRLLVERLEVLPLRQEENTLFVAMIDPLDSDTIEQLQFFTGCRIKPVIATLTQIRKALTRLLSDYKPTKSYLEDFLENHALSASQKMRLHSLVAKDPKTVLGSHAPEKGGTPKAHATRDHDRSLDLNNHNRPITDGTTRRRTQTANAKDVFHSKAASNPFSVRFPSSPSADGDSFALDDEVLPLDLERVGPNDLELNPADDILGVPDDASASNSPDDVLIFESEVTDEGMTFEAATERELQGRSAGDQIEDDPLGDTLETQDGAETLPDLSFIEDTGHAMEGETVDDDLDADAAQEIVALGDLRETFKDEKDLYSHEADRAKQPTTQAPLSNDELLDLNTLASDLKSLDDALMTENHEGPSPVKEQVSWSEEDNVEAFSAKEGPASAAPSAADALETDEDLHPEDGAVDPLDAAAFEEIPSSPHIPMLNRFMLTMSLLADPFEALEKAIPVLTEAGITRGVVISLGESSLAPLGGWGLSDQMMEKEEAILNRFLSPGVGDWLSTSPDDLTPLGPETGRSPMALYAPWIAGGQRQLYSFITPSADPLKRIAFITGWDAVAQGDATLRNMTSEIFRKLAQRM